MVSVKFYISLVDTTAVQYIGSFAIYNDATVAAEALGSVGSLGTKPLATVMYMLATSPGAARVLLAVIGVVVDLDMDIDI